MSTKQPNETLHPVRELSFILRNRALWPKGFEWDYIYCESCAMGLAFELGMAPQCNTLAIAVQFNMSRADATNIFIYAGQSILTKLMQDITPEHIADLLDAYAGRVALEGKP